MINLLKYVNLKLTLKIDFFAVSYLNIVLNFQINEPLK